MSTEKELKRIADQLEKLTKFYDDPKPFLDKLAKLTYDSVAALNVPVSVAAPTETEPGTRIAGPIITSIQVSLSKEERAAICNQAFSEIESQMTEFKGFIAQSLTELSDSQLKRLGELLAKGEKFRIRRRRGDCITLDFGHGDDEFWLSI
jgi:hypothetical protein